MMNPLRNAIVYRLPGNVVAFLRARGLLGANNPVLSTADVEILRDSVVVGDLPTSLARHTLCCYVPDFGALRNLEEATPDELAENFLGLCPVVAFDMRNDRMI